MKNNRHFSNITRDYEITIPASALIRYDPKSSCVPLGYVEGIQSGGGSLLEAIPIVILDNLCALTKSLEESE